jgi:hypothetical protein
VLDSPSQFSVSSHLIEKSPFVAYFFVSSTDAMTDRQGGRFQNQQHLCEESPVLCCFSDEVQSDLSGNSTTLNSLQFDVWVFGIAYLKIALFDMALRQFFFVFALYVEGRRPSGCLPTSRPS